ncbi:MAG: hypothetical protein ACXIU7_03795 [Roseinatronobacter sp.]
MSDPMEQAQAAADVAGPRSRRAERQARVGIIANPVEIDLPIHPPREVWSRWPKLRSARRPGAPGAVPTTTEDRVLSGELLASFAQDLRQPDLNESSQRAAAINAPSAGAATLKGGAVASRAGLRIFAILGGLVLAVGGAAFMLWLQYQ